MHSVSGGGGRRKLTAVSPQAEGYTTSDLKRASNGGKIALYIAPIHGQLDVTPVARNASEFSKMSKVTCEICRESMPSHLLSLHVMSCEAQQSEVSYFNHMKQDKEPCVNDFVLFRSWTLSVSPPHLPIK